MIRKVYAALALFPMAVMAQPVLDSAMVLNGTVHLEAHQVTNLNGFTITPGPAQTWDVTGISLATMGYAAFMPTSASDYAATYADTDMSLHIDAQSLGIVDNIFMNLSSTGLELAVTDVPNSPRVYSDPQRLLSFPMQFGSSVTDTYNTGSGEQTSTWTYSGYGTLVSTYGTFTNVVLTTDGNNGFILWNTAPLYPMVLSRGSVLVALRPLSGMGVERADVATLQLWPNPAQDVLYVAGHTAGDQWQVLDASGRIVERGRWTSAENATIGVADLSEGIYHLHVLGAAGRRVRTFVKP